MRQPDQEFRDNHTGHVHRRRPAIVFASCIGFLFARNLVSPINRMTRRPKAIGDGDLSAARI